MDGERVGVLSSRGRHDAQTSRVAMAVTLLPFLVAAVALIVVVRGSYLPSSDHALTEMHVRDVGHHPVLVGLYSRDDWSHPGPMLFYLLAPFYWLTGGSSIGLNLGALAINAASIAGMGIVAIRRGGTTLMLCTLLACSLLIRTTGADFVRDPWNTYVTVLPFALLVFLVWSMVCGEIWALPVGVFVASFLAQTHVGFVVLALPLFGFGAVWLAVSVLRSSEVDSRRQLRRVGVGSGLLALVLWSPVIVDSIVHRPSNLTRIIRWFRDPKDGIHTVGDGWRVISGQFAAVPEWLTSLRAPQLFTGESPFLHNAPLPLLLVLVALAAVGFSRLMQRDGLRLLATFGVAFILGVLAVQRTVGLAFDYRLRWTWVIGMIGFIAIVWCAALAVQKWDGPVSPGLVPAVLVIGLVVCTIVNVTTAATAGTPQAADTKVLAALTPGVLQALGSDPAIKHGEVFIDDGPFQISAWYSRSLVLQLERHGYDARMPAPRGVFLGDHRELDNGPVAAHLVVAMDDEIEVRDADPALHLVAKWSSVTADQQLEHKAKAAALDRDFAAGRIDAAHHALGLVEISLGNDDPAVAWAVAVYRADSNIS